LSLHLRISQFPDCMVVCTTWTFTCSSQRWRGAAPKFQKILKNVIIIRAHTILPLNQECLMAFVIMAVLRDFSGFVDQGIAQGSRGLHVLHLPCVV